MGHSQRVTFLQLYMPLAREKGLSLEDERIWADHSFENQSSFLSIPAERRQWLFRDVGWYPKYSLNSLAFANSFKKGYPSSHFETEHAFVMSGIDTKRWTLLERQ